MNHLILTHEHADFDAVASLLAAALLYPEGRPVLPVHINRNVRDFLTIYWNELPFVEFAARPRGRIAQITMVDTQYVPAMRGQKADTRIRIIDHHDPGEHLPTHADVSLVQTGANVTYLTQELARTNQPITAVQATLMLLGIYEDCGHLMYNNTTVADLKAAAWLVEQGARIDVLRDFLNYSMNPAQKRLYNSLINNLEFLHIKGREILVGAVHADEHVTEISTLAHQLRDLYNPDGLFMIVAFHDPSNEYTQMVARSTTDAINVGDIAESFGGGGHPRAAAAHISDESLPDIVTRLHHILEQTVQPATTVRQIMSYRVSALHPNQTIREAADKMKRRGHEGYPVVEDGDIVGILTRRQIDKAVHHGLQTAPISQYMTAGEIYVSPADTVEQVQALMLREQVGQVPVVDDGEIIGVVTRTDLINLWSKGIPNAPQTLNLATELAHSLPPAMFELLRDAGRIAGEINCVLYIVGGFVRDLLLQRPRADIDLVVEGDALKLAQAMQHKYGGRIVSHKRFGTANWIIEGAVNDVERLDFVTARTEFYEHPSALPEVEYSSIKQDLHRRDFTINTLAVRTNPAGFGELLDFYGGYKNLQEGLIRVLHSLSFVEDPTRILRAIRLEQRLGFRIGRRTTKHLKRAIDLLPRVSADRIFTELWYSLKEAAPEKVFCRLAELGILQAIHPALCADAWFNERSQTLRQSLGKPPWPNIQPQAVHYFGLLTYRCAPADVDSLRKRMHIKKTIGKILQQVQHLKQLESSLATIEHASAAYALLHTFDTQALIIAWVAFDDPLAGDWLVRFEQSMRAVKPLIDGDFLIGHFKLRPSPQFTHIFNQLRNARLDGHLNTLEEEMALVEEILNAKK